jgi:hypothetical protein
MGRQKQKDRHRCVFRCFHKNDRTGEETCHFCQKSELEIIIIDPKKDAPGKIQKDPEEDSKVSEKV